jgi:hypothetical protein
MIAADRAVQVARTVGEPLLVAASAYRLANVFLPTGRLVEAKEVALAAASSLEPDLDTSTAHLATWGGLLLTAAVAAAQRGDGREAWELIGEAKAAARRLGTDYADLHTIFGPVSLAIQGVQVAAELGDGREVLRRAQSVDPGGLPPYLVERRTHFLIDVARGHAHRADDSAALATLLEAERLASEEVATTRLHPSWSRSCSGGSGALRRPACATCRLGLVLWRSSREGEWLIGIGLAVCCMRSLAEAGPQATCRHSCRRPRRPAGRSA